MTSKRPENTIIGHVRNGFLARMMQYSPPAIVVWLALANRADRRGWCNPSISTLQNDTGLARATVVRALDDLEKAEEISRTHGEGVGSEYVVVGSSANEPVQQMNRIGSANEPDQFSRCTGPVQQVNSNYTQEPNTRTKRKNQTRRKAGDRAAAVVEIPAVLDADVFREAWGRWMLHRSEMRKPLTPSTAAAQLKKLSAIGQARAVAAIDRSIEAGWTGIFEENQNGNARKNHSPVGPGQRHPDDAARNEF